MKKGQIVLKPMIELLVAATIFLLFILVGMRYGTGTIFQQVATAADNAASINTLYALPDTASIDARDSSKFIVNFDSSSTKILIMDEDPIAARDFFDFKIFILFT